MPKSGQKKNINQQLLSSFAMASPKANEQANEAVADTSTQQEPAASNTPTATDGIVARELANMSRLIKDTSEAQDKKLEDIKRSTFAVENKLTEISERLNHVEARLTFLEEANQELQENPPATREEVELLRQKLDNIENRERRNNLRFVGFPEECEGGDARAFLCDNIPKTWNIDFAERLEIDRAHRIGARRQSEPGQTPRPRALIARFLRFQDRERIVEAARKGKVTWNGHNVMVFPDYSKIVTDKRLRFNECKKLLHDRRMKFSLVFPALLVIRAPEGRREFDDPKKARAYIHSLG